MVTIREITNMQELKWVVEIACQIWAGNEPLTHDRIRSTISIGGYVLGAFTNNQLIGYQYCLCGFDGKQVYSYCEELAVLPKFRNQGIGTRLMKEGRDFALKKGYERMVWTFDPLQTANGYVYINKLGAIVSTYLEDYYGELKDPMNQGLPTDRFLAKWDFEKPEDIENNLPIETNPLYAMECESDEKRFSKIKKVDWRSLKQDKQAFLIPIPSNFTYLRDHQIEVAIHWQTSIRDIFQDLFKRHYQLIAVSKQTKYPNTIGYVVQKNNPL